MLTERFIDTGETQIRISAGPTDGPPILFLHGVSRLGRDFAPVFPALAGSWHLHTIDHRGHGKSGRVPGAYRITDYVRDAVAIVRTFSEPVILFGHSLGAVTAAAVAASEPDRVRAAILEDPPSAPFLARLDRTPYYSQFAAVRAFAGSTQSVSAIARSLAAIPLPQPDGRTARLGDFRDMTSLRFSARCLPDLDPGTFDPILDRSWFHGYDEHSIWKAIQCPVLLLRGEEARGGMLPATDAERMASTILDCSRIDVPGVGHLIHWFATESCMRLVLGFLESL